MSGFSLFRGALALAALLAPSLTHAAPVSPTRNATATVEIATSATIRKIEDLNFAMLTVTTAGPAVVNPNTDTMTTTGGVIHAGGVPYAALFEAISPSKNVVIIRIPRIPTTVTRVGGTETMRVDTWTLSGSANRNVVAREPFQFKIGGTLHVNTNQAEGTYLGTFLVEIQFP
ncbi:DUF4402 domain-containing protein [Sphingomonas sp.]|uniref:DUF4402 domain-containing protein n=1 Tax=Sphingomonas sp. TaxID=28214 RepID=UPI00286D81EB|nr:DUF4402 domain-containing protein [Sphingomonas sp.]